MHVRGYEKYERGVMVTNEVYTSVELAGSYRMFIDHRINVTAGEDEVGCGLDFPRPTYKGVNRVMLCKPYKSIWTRTKLRRRNPAQMGQSVA